MGLIDVLIDILLEKKSFETALQLANSSCKEKIFDVYTKFGIELEKNKNYDRAEEYYLHASQPQRCIQMYIQIHEFNSALRIARQYDSTLIPSIYMAQAKIFLDKKDYVKAELCLVKANKPEDMVDIYLKENKFDLALNFAKKYVVELVPELLKYVENKESQDLLSNDLRNKANELSKKGKYEQAIDIYFEILNQMEKKSQNKENIENIIDTINYHASLLQEGSYKNGILNQVVLKYKEYGINEKAARITENFEESITDFKMIGIGLNSNQSNKNLNTNSNTNSNPVSKKNSQTSFNRNDGYKEQNVDKPALLFEKHDFDKCIELARQNGVDTEVMYIIKIASAFINEKNLAGCAEFLLRHEIPITKNILILVENLAMEILAEENPDELDNLKYLLKFIIRGVSAFGTEFESQAINLSRLLLISHYQYNKTKLRTNKSKFPNIYYKLCLSLLRYGDVIKMDICLLEAALASREAVINIYLNI